MKKLISIILLLGLLTGCSNKNELDKMSIAIINFHQDYNYNIDDLSDKNKQVLEEFKFKELEENKVINISKLDLFSDDITTLEPDTEGVYYENGNYYIKYKDLNFKKINEKDYIATINVNGYIINLSKSNFPILYYDTRNINYKYRFIKKVVNGSEIKYYYRSYGTGGMLTINYKMHNNNVSDIDLIYDDYYLLDEVEPATEQKSNFGYIAFMIGVALFLGFVIFKSLKNYANARKY